MVQRITLAPQGPEFSRFVMGYWRLMDWNMSAQQLVSFIEEHLDLGGHHRRPRRYLRRLPV